VVDAAALRLLVGEVASFLDELWGRRPLHVPARGERDALAGLLTLDDVDAIVAGSGLRAPAFRLVKQGATRPHAEVTRHVRIGSRPVSDLVDVAAVHDAVAGGATLVLQGLHRSFPKVTAFCRDLERTLTHPVQANAYLTPPVAQGLDLHSDPHDVFAIQTFGTKRWVVHPPDEPEPWDLQLSPGDVLYLPKGTRHAAQTVDAPSLHLTIGIRTIAWRQLLDRAVRSALADLDGLDQPLPAGWAEQPELLTDQLAQLSDGLTERLHSDGRAADAMTHEAEGFWATRPVDRTGGLRDLLEVDGLEDATPLRRREGATARVHGTEHGHVQLTLIDRALRLPSSVETAVRRIVDGEVARPADLDDLMDQESRLVLCRRLVREGFFAIDRRRGRAGA
jgi:bifunctional lysine-specific demethylase and histidyl-hydroxylase NO66